MEMYAHKNTHTHFSALIDNRKPPTNHLKSNANSMLVLYDDNHHHFCHRSLFFLNSASVGDCQRRLNRQFDDVVIRRKNPIKLPTQ